MTDDSKPPIISQWPKERPVVPMRSTAPKPKAQLNPFGELQAANKESQQLYERLQALADKLVGPSPPYDAINDEPPGALMPLAARVAQLIQERSRHGVSLIDKIEEHLG